MLRPCSSVPHAERPSLQAHARPPPSPRSSRQGRFRQKSRALGYQQVEAPSNPHLQWTALQSKIQTGLPMVPARRATAVSTVITRSSLATTAAKAAKSGRLAQSSAKSNTWPVSAASWFMGPIWSEMKRTPSTCARSCQCVRAMERNRSRLFFGLPAQQMPTRKARQRSGAAGHCSARTGAIGGGITGARSRCGRLISQA